MTRGTDMTTDSSSESSDDTSDHKRPVEESSDEEVVEEIAVSRPSAKRPKLTAEDIQVARETAELFKSNIFKLEIDELVRELRLKDRDCQLMEHVLHRLHDTLQAVPESDPMTLQECLDHFSAAEVAIPFPDPKPTSVKYKFKYEKPEDVSLVGSFGLKTGIKQPEGMAIDVAMTMPRTLFSPKDYLNYRAFYKRAVYLAWVAEKLVDLSTGNHLPIKLSYEYADEDVLCPTLRIESVAPEKPSEQDLIFENTGFVIRLYAAFPFGCFEAKKLLPDRNCIRVQAPEGEELPPTPLYNASLLTASSYGCYTKYLYAAKKTAEAFRDACVLSKLWLKQHGFTSAVNDGGFGHFEMVTLMAALLDGGGENGSRVLLHGFSSYQLFKATIRYIATQEICHDGYLSFGSVIGEHKSNYRKGGFDVPTIFDRNTKINILWKMTPSSYKLLRLYAQQTSNLLNDVVQDRFPRVFTHRVKQLFKYDTVLHIPISAIAQSDNFGSLEKISFLTYDKFICWKVYKMLAAALGNRVLQASVSVSAVPGSWSLMRRRPATEDSRYINVGLLIDPAESEKRVTKGPLHSEKAEGEKFASFWGSKAQVRKYKDGNIQYSCLWPSSTTESTTVIIAKYILDLHLTSGISSKIIINSTKFAALLPPSLTNSGANSHPLIMPTHYGNLKRSYDALCKIIFNSKTPLTVKAILPSSAALRETSLLLPVPYTVANPDFFCDSVVQFETSTRWPDELFALEDTKTAFLLKIAASINGKERYKAFMMRDNSIPYLEDKVTVLNVLTPEGYGFRFRVLTERDEALYLRAIENSHAKQKQAVTEAYVKFLQKYINGVKHHRLLSTLVSRYPFFSASVRLFKKWLDSQMLLSVLAEETVEILAIQAFVDPSPYFIPASVETGFLRILDFISRWNWIDDPLIVDLNADSDDGPYTELSGGKLSVGEYQIMTDNFKELRRQDPSGARVQLFVASRIDPSGKLWTTNKTGLPIASRLTSLCKAVVGLFSKSLNVSESLLRLSFTPAVKDFDFVIELKAPSDLREKSGVLAPGEFKNLIKPPTSFPKLPETQLDPIQVYYQELRCRFSNVAVLFVHRFTCLSDKDGQHNVIAGLFNPAVVKVKKGFRTNLGYNVKPTDDGHVECNQEVILSQMVKLGGDLVVGFERYH